MPKYDFAGTSSPALGDERGKKYAGPWLGEGVCTENIVETPTATAATTTGVADLGAVGDDAVGTYQASYQEAGAGAVQYADFHIYKHGPGDYRVAGLGTSEGGTATNDANDSRASLATFVFQVGDLSESSANAKMHLTVATAAQVADSTLVVTAGNFYIVDALNTTAKTWRIERTG
tara:strand:+ start:519 stop:1046 length:528 start_codon:yes stop_codon:yes gene_type:complete